MWVWVFFLLSFPGGEEWSMLETKVGYDLQWETPGFSCQPWLCDIYCGVGWDLALIHGRIGIKNDSEMGNPREEEEMEFEGLSVIQNTWTWSFLVFLEG